LARFGRIGTDGQTAVKQLASDGESTKTYNKLIREKTAKGYKLAEASAKTSETATTAMRRPREPQAPLCAPDRAASEVS